MDKLKGDYADLLASSDECLDDDQDISEKISETEKSIKEEMEPLAVVWKDEGFEGVKKQLRDNCERWKTVALHIAVTGFSGAGKSAFINAIRDVSAEDECGARVGVTETTATLMPYKHPKNPNFIVWDMPGVGTPKFPKEKYLKNVNFDQYDFFMILSKGRFTEEDLWLAKQIQERKKRFYFIRTGIDEDIRNNKRAYPNSHTPGNVMAEIRSDIKQNLTDADIIEPHVFLVDNHDKQNLDFEFGRLEEQLIKDSDSLKIEAMALSLSAVTKEVLMKKKEFLEAKIENKALEIACNLDDDPEQKLVFEQEINYYKEQFDIDDQTLSSNKDILKLTDENMKEFRAFFQDLSECTTRELCQKLVKTYRKRSILWRLLRSILKSFFLDVGEGSRLLSSAVLQFCCLALHQNLEVIYRLSLKVYNFDTQKDLVKSFMSRMTKTT